TTMFFLPPNQTPAVAESLTSALRRPLTRFVRPLDLSAVAVSEPNQLPGTIELYPAYPNPFNSSTQVRFSLPRAERVRLAVYDLVGHQVSVLVDRRLGAGTHRVVWSGVDASRQPVPSGLYFVRLQAGPVSRTRKVLLLK
ncbi:MAG TPA: T9SS type A sorting domain-containing protein, partial [Bacteroidetes bacterium]|nr:T9SS type A sorting domain-containing protein [Bacteroidota bacterium]